MSEERFKELWAQVEHIGKIEHLSDDALLALGGIFGELKSKINEQAERVQELERANKKLERQALGVELDLLNMELTDALKQNKRYREALQHIEENSNDKVAVFIASRALEGEFNE